ncbi:MAG: glucose 1-dehydrogenase [Chloroflexota bacterium]
MTQRLANKVALVTGAASGIGRATSVAFAQEGARVVLADVNIDGCEETRQTIKNQGGEAITVLADVTHSPDVKAMVEKTVSVYGQLDCAFNCAGMNTAIPAHVADCEEEEWFRVIDINLKGVFLCMKYELQQMRKQQTGAIVNVASIYGLVAEGNEHYGVSAYAASKHGVIGLTKASSLEYAKAGIRINAICPGHTDTPLIHTTTSDPERLTRLIARYPVGRIGRPEEIAEAVIWLCSDAASFVTGHAMAVDGGYVVQ